MSFSFIDSDNIRLILFYCSTRIRLSCGMVSVSWTSAVAGRSGLFLSIQPPAWESSARLSSAAPVLPPLLPACLCPNLSSYLFVYCVIYFLSKELGPKHLETANKLSSIAMAVLSALTLFKS